MLDRPESTRRADARSADALPRGHYANPILDADFPDPAVILAADGYYYAYATQTLRAALNAVPSGQRLAALALGLSKSHIFFRIVLPQAWRHALPGLGNQWLVLLKDTALVSLIGVNEMMRQAQMASASTYEPFTWYAAAALIYLAISLVSEYGLGLAARYTRRYGG